MRQLADPRGGAERPVGAVVGVVLGHDPDAGLRVDRHVVERPGGAGGFARGPRPRGELHRAFARPARAGEIGRQRLLIEFDDGVGFGAGVCEHGRNPLHHIDDLVPAGLVEAELQHIARRVAAGALVGEDLLDAGVVLGRFRQRRDQQLARQLPDALLGIAHLAQHEVLALGGAEVDRALGGLEAERLRPDLILSFRHWREVVVASLIGIDAGGDGGAFLLGGHRHAFELLARGRGDRTAQQLIGRRSGRGCCQTGNDQGRRACQ